MDSFSTISSDEMKALEMNAEYFGISPLQMMENAGNAVAREIVKRFTSGNTQVTIFVGTGGNGGDGLVAARHLSALGYRVKIILVGRESNIVLESVKKNWKAIQFMTESVEIVKAYDSSLIPKIEGGIVVDALLGTGIKGSLKPPILQAVQAFNEAHGFKVAVDVPSGLNSESGKILEECIIADLTITFHRIKIGLLKAKKHVGELIVTDIGLPREIETLVGPGDVFLINKPRLRETHKGDHGRLLIIGGNEIYTGAPTLAALAALRVGVDLVYIATPRQTAHDIASISPSFITLKLDGEHLTPTDMIILKQYIEKVDAVVLGPGLGVHRETIEAVKKIVEIIETVKVPLLLDADGLKAFSEGKHRVDTPLVLTPHAGEYKILMGRGLPTDLRERIKAASKAAREVNGVILLKGSIDIITDGKRVKVNEIIHNPGMTVGGTGDVLSGIVGGLLSQGNDAFRAATAGVFINGAAGDFVAQEKGFHMLPTDIIEWIPKVMDKPMSHLTIRRI
jgi:NAD(P)H-hydrate epimerase